jgi:hypothetical protein
MFWAIAVLREQARPVLPTVPDLGGPLICPSVNGDEPSWSHSLNGSDAFCDDFRIDGIECDSESEDATGIGRDASIAQIHPQEVCICSGIER